MSTYVLIHGAGGSDSSYWELVTPLLRDRGHDVVAPDLPSDDPSANLTTFADVVVDAIGDRTDLVVVGQSFAGFTAPLVCARVPASLLVMVAAMIPRPGESAHQWFANTGWPQARREQNEREGKPADAPMDMMDVFFHDVPKDITDQAKERGMRDEAATPFDQPWPLDAWPDVPTRFLLCRQDRFFPADFMHRVVRDRLDLKPDEIDSGHLAALAHPEELTGRLEAYRAERQAGRPVR